jgi:hypothetical protein
MKRLLILLLLLLPGTAGAAVFHAVPTAGVGDSTGSDWENAMTLVKAEARCPRGDSIAVADGEYPSVTFNTADSSGVSITVFKATHAGNHGRATGWNSAYGDGQAVFTGSGNVWSVRTNNWILDGVSAVNDTLGHGFKIVPVDAGAKGIDIRGLSAAGVAVPDSLEFRYIEIAQQGLDTETADDGIYVNLSTDDGGKCTDVLVSHCYIHDAGRVHMLLTKCSNWIVEYTYCARNSSSSEQHSESVVSWGNDNMTFRYCTFADIEGTGVIVPENDALVGGVPNSDFKVYGNLFFYTYGNPYNRTGTSPSGPIGSSTNDTVNNLEFYNNTIVNWSYGNNSGIYINHGTGNKSYNNLWFNCAKWALELNNAVMASDYNWFVNTARAYGSVAGANDVVTAAADTNTVFTDHLSYDFSLLAASAVLCTTLAAEFSTDRTGATRGDDGAWDSGYLEYDANPSGPEGTVTHYVHPDGGGTGTADDPYATIAAAEAAADSNDVIVLDGNLRGQKITVPAGGMTYRGRYNASPPIVGGRVRVSGFGAMSTIGADSTALTDDGYDSLYRVYPSGAHLWKTSNSVGYGSIIYAGEIDTGYPSYSVHVFPSVPKQTATAAYLRLYVFAETSNKNYWMKIINQDNVSAPTDTTTFAAMLADTTGTGVSTGTATLDSGFVSLNVTDLYNAVAGREGFNNKNNMAFVTIPDLSGTGSLYWINAANTTYTGARVARLVVEYGSAGNNYQCEIAEAYRGFTRVWKSGVALEQVAAWGDLAAGKFYKSATGDTLGLYVTSKADTTGIEIDGIANAVDYNGMENATVYKVVIDGNVNCHAVKMSGLLNKLYNCVIASALKAVYILGDSARIYNVAFAVSDSLLTETGTGAVYTHNAFDTDYEVPASPGANDVLAAELWTGENYEPTEEMRDKGYDVGLPYNGSAPDIGASELEALAVARSGYVRRYLFKAGYKPPLFGDNRKPQIWSNQ